MPDHTPPRPLVLASTSRFRAELLARLGVTFTQVAPGVDERPLPGEEARTLAHRLALAKARAVAVREPGAVVIGSDQVAELDGATLGKPGTRAANVEQLLAAAGREVHFNTGLAVIDASSGEELVDVVPFTVRFRALTRARIERYVDLEDARDCAGGFRCEGLGIALFEALRGDDPTALVGLPLIRLTSMLATLGVDVLGDGGAARAALSVPAGRSA